MIQAAKAAIKAERNIRRARLIAEDENYDLQGQEMMGKQRAKRILWVCQDNFGR